MKSPHKKIKKNLYLKDKLLLVQASHVQNLTKPARTTPKISKIKTGRKIWYENRQKLWNRNLKLHSYRAWLTLHTLLTLADVAALSNSATCKPKSPLSSPQSRSQAIGCRSRWRNGLARLQQWLCYLQGPGLESLLRPVAFSACKKVHF